MKKRLVSLVMAGIMALSMAACGGSSTSGGAAATTAAASQAAGGASTVDASKAELNLIIASNQTSEENPYSIAMDEFKRALEEVSGGKATLISSLHHRAS